MEYDDKKAWREAEQLGMTLYYIFLLKKGPAWTPDSTSEISELQEKHLANYRRLTEAGKLVLTGPFLDSLQLSGEIRGAGILKSGSYSEAMELIKTDPMVEVGRLVYELHAWMVTKHILP